VRRDPLADLADAPLFIVPRVLDGLRAYRQRVQPGILAAPLDALVERLLTGVEAHPTKFWVMQQFQNTLHAAGEDADTRKALATELEQLMAILGIGSSDGILGIDHR
jgi:hypothetical protein